MFRNLGKTKTFRLSDKSTLYLEQTSVEKGISENEFINDVLEGKEEVTTKPEMKEIILKFDGKCLKCGHDVKAGEPAMWGQGVGIICMDCQIVHGLGDKAIIKKYLKMRRMAEATHYFQAEVERLADKVEIGQLTEKIEKADEKITAVRDLVKEYTQQSFTSDEEKQKLEEVHKAAEELREELELAKEIAWLKRKVIKEKKPIEQTEAAT